MSKGCKGTGGSVKVPCGLFFTLLILTVRYTERPRDRPISLISRKNSGLFSTASPLLNPNVGENSSFTEKS
jgi:hypothetical protein